MFQQKQSHGNEVLTAQLNVVYFNSHLLIEHKSSVFPQTNIMCLRFQRNGKNEKLLLLLVDSS